jgi:RNA polymerase sigma factor (sigma-70 family)
MSTDPGAPATPAPHAPPVAGDAWAHRDDLVAYARRLLGVHGEMAEDVVQEAYLRLHESAAAGAPVEEARPWLFRVARNLALDERRRGRRGDDVLSSLEVVSAGPRGPLEVLQAREEARQALEGLDALPPRERRTVILDQAGLAPPAIARRMHTTTNAVHQALFRARRRMRDARAAALGLLPLPLVRLMFRATASPTFDRLPALAPGSGGRLAGGAGLAGLVAAAVIGGGAVADRPLVPSPSGPARAAEAAPVASAVPAATTPVYVATPAAGSPAAVTVAIGVRASSRAAAVAGLRGAPARRADPPAADDGRDAPSPSRERSSGADDGDAESQGRGAGGEEGRGERGERGERGRAREGGAEPSGRRARSGRDDGDERGSDGGGGRGRDEGRDTENGGPSLAAAPAAPRPDVKPEGDAAVTAPESPVQTPAPEESVVEPPVAPGPDGQGAEPAPPASVPPPGGGAGPAS